MFSFDLKGSKIARYVDTNDEDISGQLLKDENLKEINNTLWNGKLVMLSTEQRENLLCQIKKDSEFLRDRGIMDYSLLLIGEKNKSRDISST